MKACVVTVKTYEEAKCTPRSYFGEAEVLSAESAKVIFSDENGKITLNVSKNLTMERAGEYNLSFNFCKGKITQAKIGLGESAAAIPLYTEEYAFSVRENLIRVYIKYSLNFGKEKQNLKVVLAAEIKQP